jgi:HK97 family phage prohead protease
MRNLIMPTPQANSAEKITNAIEYKTFKFNLSAVEETKAASGRFGIIKGYASTFGNVDRGNDVMVKGAFVKSIDWYRQEGKLIPMCYQHSMMHPIGGFNPAKMYEDEKGLWVEGEINLDTDKGPEAYALAKQGVLTDMSIGFTCQDYELSSKSGEESDNGSIVRKIKEVMLWEVSPVVVPMNPQAKITDVKSFTFDFPMAEKGTSWDEEIAIKNIKKFTKAEVSVTQDYRKCFLYFDGKDVDSFESYHIPFVDTIKGKLRAVPHAVFSAGKSISTGNHNLTIVDSQLLNAKIKINKYYEHLGAEIPFKGLDIDGVVGVDDLQIDNKSDIIDDKNLLEMKKSQLERVLRETGRFSRNAAKCLVSCLDLNKLSKYSSKQEIKSEELTDLLNTFKQREAVISNKNQNIDPKLTTEISSLLIAIRSSR